MHSDLECRSIASRATINATGIPGPGFNESLHRHLVCELAVCATTTMWWNTYRSQPGRLSRAFVEQRDGIPVVFKRDLGDWHRSRTAIVWLGEENCLGNPIFATILRSVRNPQIVVLILLILTTILLFPIQFRLLLVFLNFRLRVSLSFLIVAKLSSFFLDCQ